MSMKDLKDPLTMKMSMAIESSEGSFKFYLCNHFNPVTCMRTFLYIMCNMYYDILVYNDYKFLIGTTIVIRFEFLFTL